MQIQPSTSIGFRGLQGYAHSPVASKKHRTIKNQVVVDTFAGTVGGMAMTIVGHPFDTVKVSLQTQPSSGPRLYNGMLDCARQIVRAEGLQGLYAGVSSPIAGQMAFRATLFGSLGSIKRLIASYRPSGQLKYGDFYLAGGLGGLVASSVICPIDLFKCQLQAQQMRMCSDATYRPNYKSLRECAIDIVKRKGILGWYQGIGPTALRETLAYAAFLGTFDVMKCELARAWGMEPHELPFGSVCLAGGLGGIIYWTSIYPIDVVKSAVQSRDIDAKHRSSLRVAQELYKDGGLPRFSRGFLPCIIRAAPANMAMFIAMDYARQFVENIWSQ